MFTSTADLIHTLKDHNPTGRWPSMREIAPGSADDLAPSMANVKLGDWAKAMQRMPRTPLTFSTDTEDVFTLVGHELYQAGLHPRVKRAA